MSAPRSQVLTATVNRIATSRGTPPAVRDQIVAIAQQELLDNHEGRVPDETAIGEAVARAEAAWGRRLRNALYAFDAFG
ncbi:MAG: hypothetical protein AAGD38_15900 [Acidobacteriota bacterium]